MSGPEGPPTIRASAWLALRVVASNRLSREQWQTALAPPAPDVDALSGDEVVPLEPFRKTLEAMSRTDPRVPAEVGAELARAWGRRFDSLHDELENHTGRALGLYAHAFRPFLLPSSKPVSLSTTDDRGLVRLDGLLPVALETRMIEEFAGLSGVTATATAEGESRIAVAWRVPRSGARAGGWIRTLERLQLPFVGATLVPFLVALAIAARDGPLDQVAAALTLAGVLAFHVAANVMNAYYRRRGQRAQRSASSPFGGGAEWLAPGRLHPEQLKWVAYAMYAIGIGIGLLLVASHGSEILWLGLAGFLLGLLYSAPPIRLAYRGLGELAVAVGFGPLIVLGTYFVQRHAWALEPLLASLPVAFLIAAVLYVNEFLDRQEDAQVGKHTLIVRLPETPAIVGYLSLLALTYLTILGGVTLKAFPEFAAYAFPPWTLLGLATLPLAVWASVGLTRNYRLPYRLVPINAATVLLHLVTGLLFTIGYLVPA